MAQLIYRFNKMKARLTLCKDQKFQKENPIEVFWGQGKGQRKLSMSADDARALIQSIATALSDLEYREAGLLEWKERNHGNL